MAGKEWERSASTDMIAKREPSGARRGSQLAEIKEFETIVNPMTEPDDNSRAAEYFNGHAHQLHPHYSL